jgi:hypothetical protein
MKSLTENCGRIGDFLDFQRPRRQALVLSDRLGPFRCRLIRIARRIARMLLPKTFLPVSMNRMMGLQLKNRMERRHGRVLLGGPPLRQLRGDVPK